MIPSGYSRSVFSGALPGGEIWQTGLWANEAPSDQAATQSQSDAFAAEFHTYWSSVGGLQSLNPLSMTVTKCTVYSYLDDTGVATHVAETVMNESGAVTTQTLPNQCALVLTLHTGVAGRRSRGRNYMPLLAAGLTAGQLSPSALPNIVAAWGGFINDLNGHLGDQSIGVLSQVAGTFQTAVAVSVDSRIDIQRRRAESQAIAGTATHVVG